MRIELDDPSLVDDLADFLRRCGYRPAPAGRAALEAAPETAPLDARLSDIQLDGYLRVWGLMHPGAGAHLRRRPAAG